MTTNTKAGKTTAKKARCKMASPISNDRAEAFVGPQAEVCPRFSEASRLRFGLVAEVPTERDKQAFDLQAKGWDQRRIAAKLKCTQPTVLRGIRRMEKWLATTLPEDRGEYTATEKLRLALARHERLMERLLKMSLREFRRSRKTIPMNKTISTTETVNAKGSR